MGEIEKEKDMRLIDADKLLYDDIDCKDGHTYMVVRAFEIDSQPTVEVPQWIPCSERLPEETGYYLCSVEWYGTSTKELLISNGHEIQDRIMLIHYLESNKSFKEAENFSTYKVIAWQPLPSVWKGENNG